MRRHVAKLRNTRGFERYTRVKATGDGLAHDGLPLLLQQSDEPFLGLNVVTDAPVNIVQVADNGILLGEGRKGNTDGFDAKVGKAVSRYAIRPYVKLAGNPPALQSQGQICPDYPLARP